MDNITRINDSLLQQNRKLKEEIEQKNKNEAYDQQLFLDLSKKYKAALEKIAKLEAELNELRTMQSESNSSSGGSTGEISGTLYGAHVRSPLRRACIGD
jgi:predicted RNase H-like nuclease (RuvC/YqgF family)